MRAIVRIPYVVWRDGKPRFVPSPALRALGFKGQDLRDPAGAWLDLRRAEDWAQRKLAEIAARKANPGKRPRPHGPRAVTLEDLFEDLWRLRKFRDAGGDGSLSPASVRDYRVKANALAKFAPELWTSPAAAVSRAVALGLHESLWEAKGLSMANGVIAVLRLAYSNALDRRPEAGLVNPFLRLRLPSPKPRVRVATPAEVEALLRAADAAEPAIGDAILLALLTGQRQGDLLKVSERQIEQGRVALEQGKTGARVGMKILAALQGRLAAARARRIAAGRLPQTFVWDPRTSRPYVADTFRHRFAEVREAACAIEPSLADFYFMDLRDTAITWLANAGATDAEICAVSGHSPQTIAQIKKHYLEANEEQANNALDKLQAWMDAQGVKL